MKDIISLSIAISKIETMSDKGLKVVFFTPEMSAEDMTKLFKFSGTQSFACIGENPINQMPGDLPKALEQKPKEGKSSSQKLRNVLYILREQDNSGFKEFNGFYEDRMQKLINQVMEKIL